MAEKKKTLKEKIKSVHKKFKDVAASGALGTGGFRRKKEKEEADPNETFGGRIKLDEPRIQLGRIKLDEPRIQTKGGSELISPKRKQGPLPKTPTLKFAGGGAVLKGKKVGCQIK